MTKKKTVKNTNNFYFLKESDVMCAGDEFFNGCGEWQTLSDYWYGKVKNVICEMVRRKNINK